jgi:hypothetical protein
VNEAKLTIQGPVATIVEADILANFQMLEEMFYQDGVEMQNSLSVSLKREICENLKHFRPLSTLTLKLNHWSAIFFFRYKLYRSEK